MKIPTIFKVVRFATLKTNKTNKTTNNVNNDSQRTPEPEPTYPTTGSIVYDTADPRILEQLTHHRTMLNYIATHWAALHLEYTALPLHVRRDLHAVAHDELIYAAAILEPDLKDLADKPTPHGEDELVPVASNWMYSMGQLMHDFSLPGVERFSAEYVNSLHTRIDDELARYTKTEEMVTLIRQNASIHPSAPIGTILREWNQACKAISQGRFIGTAVREALEASQRGPPGEIPPYPHGNGKRTYFGILLTEPSWPSASHHSQPRQKPAGRWTAGVDHQRPGPPPRYTSVETLPAYRP